LEEDWTGPLLEAWEQFMNCLMTSPKPLKKNQSKPLKNQFFLHFIDVFHIKGVSESI